MERDLMQKELDAFNEMDMKLEGVKDINLLTVPIYPEWVTYKGEVCVIYRIIGI